jgi:predicted DNA-binding transcriptional regulator AlpA
MPKLLKKTDSSRYISRQEIAEDLGIHIETVKRMEAEKRLPPAIRLSPKLIRYDRAAYEECLRTALVNGPTKPFVKESRNAKHRKTVR